MKVILVSDGGYGKEVLTNKIPLEATPFGKDGGFDILGSELIRAGATHWDDDREFGIDPDYSYYFFGGEGEVVS